MEPRYEGIIGFVDRLCLRIVIIVLMVLCIVLMDSDIKANDTSFFGIGATVYAIKENRVRMEKEVVTIRYNHDAMRLPTESQRRLSKWIADCTFTFINITNKPVEMQMGFPDTRVFGDAFRWPTWAIRDFKVMVNGDPVPTIHKDVLPGQEIETSEKTRKLRYEGAYTWQMHFKPNEQIIVKNTYTFGGGSTAMAIKDLMQEETSGPVPSTPFFWGKTKPNRCDWDFGNGPYSWVEYIVTTGLTWAGSIGEADIVIEVPPYTLPHLLLPAPDGFTIRDGFVRWHFKQWHPLNDVALYILYPLLTNDCEEDYESKPPLFDSQSQAQAWIDIAKAHHFDRHTVSLIRNAYLAKYGYRFSDEKLQKFFENQGWYKAKPDMDLKDIPEKDQRIITLLEQFEKSLK